jgi:hypothetical protein
MNLSASAPGYEPLGFVISFHQRGSGGGEFFELVGTDFRYLRNSYASFTGFPLLADS